MVQNSGGSARQTRLPNDVGGPPAATRGSSAGD